MNDNIIKKMVFRVRVGSHLYGLNTAESDEDFLSVFIPTEEYILGLKKVEEVNSGTKKSSAQYRNTKEDIDDKAYALPKFLKLVIQNNPNIVEVLFATPENILVLEPEFQEIIDNYDKIISQKVFYSFTGYAYSQRKHLIVKRERYQSLEKALEYLNGINVQSREITESESAELNHILKFYKGEKGNTEPFHKGMPLEHIYKQIKYEFDQYGYRIKEINFTGTAGEIYDAKFGYHLIRLLEEGRQLLENGRIKFPLSGKARKDILRIRNKEIPLDDLMQMYDQYNKEIEKIFTNTEIRKKPDFNWADKYLIRTLKKSLLSDRVDLKALFE